MEITWNKTVYKVIAWHEDTTRKGNYVLTLKSPMGRIIPAFESELNDVQIKALAEIPKDDTGL